MKHTLFAILLAGSTVCMAAAAQAQTPASATASASTAKPTVHKIAKKKSVKKPPPPATVDAEEAEPDVAGSKVTDYRCEMGSQLTVFQNVGDDRHIALKWEKRLHRMERVDTSTGANRFENHYYGLVWIGIPAKSMLLDSKHGRQLANECKTAEQLAPKTTSMPAGGDKQG